MGFQVDISPRLSLSLPVLTCGVQSFLVATRSVGGGQGGALQLRVGCRVLGCFGCVVGGVWRFRSAGLRRLAWFDRFRAVRRLARWWVAQAQPTLRWVLLILVAFAGGVCY